MRSDAIYDITLAGTQGGQASGFVTNLGGKGAQVGGEVFLSAGETLNIVVGRQGFSGDFGGGFGGGGGYSAVIGPSALLTMAGGGGGGASEGQGGGSGLAGTAGGAGLSSLGGAGGISGAGGGGGSGETQGVTFVAAGGGAGHISAGQNGLPGYLPAGLGGSGTTGGAGGTYSAAGGFGGGSGSGYYGGGGFSGGGGGAGGGAGGGGSYLAPLFTKTFGADGANAGNGFVTIDPVTAAVPEASTWAMMLAGFTGLGALALRKKKTTLA